VTLTIIYKGLGDDYAKSREILPLSVERAGTGWDKVVVAYCFQARAVRNFRVDRIERAERRLPEST
jgi:predicted DNA-binding transcriptional regulator YafY